MFTSRPIGFVTSPYKQPSEIPKGLGAKHEADGVLAILPEFEAGLTDIEASPISSSSGSSIVLLSSNCVGTNCSVHRPPTIGRMVCLPPDLRDVPIRLA